MARSALRPRPVGGSPAPKKVTLRTDDVGMGCAADKLHNPKLRVFYYTGGNPQIRVAFTAAMMKLKGAKIPPTIVFPIQLQDQSKRDMCAKGYPQEADATSLVPLTAGAMASSPVTLVTLGPTFCSSVRSAAKR